MTGVEDVEILLETFGKMMYVFGDEAEPLLKYVFRKKNSPLITGWNFYYFIQLNILNYCRFNLIFV